MAPTPVLTGLFRSALNPPTTVGTPDRKNSLRKGCVRCTHLLCTMFTGHFMADEKDFVGINEIAEMASVSKQAVANWRARSSDFPAPVANLASGPVFHRSQVRTWLRRRKVPMTHVLSTINLKGGVAKTTTTVASLKPIRGNSARRCS